MDDGLRRQTSREPSLVELVGWEGRVRTFRLVEDLFPGETLAEAPVDFRLAEVVLEFPEKGGLVVLVQDGYGELGVDSGVFRVHEAEEDGDELLVGRFVPMGVHVQTPHYFRLRAGRVSREVRTAEE